MNQGPVSSSFDAWPLVVCTYSIPGSTSCHLRDRVNRTSVDVCPETIRAGVCQTAGVDKTIRSRQVSPWEYRWVGKLFVCDRCVYFKA